MTLGREYSNVKPAQTWEVQGKVNPWVENNFRVKGDQAWVVQGWVTSFVCVCVWGGGGGGEEKRVLVSVDHQIQAIFPSNFQKKKKRQKLTC